MKNEIIYKYLNVCIKYFDFIEKSTFLKALYNRNFLIFIGFRAISYVFIFNSNNIDSSIENSEKAYIYYLEYLEQLDKTNMMNELNHMDAILFLYNKTIPNYTSEINTSSELYKLNPEVNKQFVHVVGFINSFLFWENQNIKRYEIMKENIFDYVKILSLPNEKINLYFELAQKNALLYDNDNYNYFLKESYKRIKQKMKINNNYWTEWKDSYINNISDMNNNNNDIKKLVKFLLY
jgi:hypothetical protein